MASPTSTSSSPSARAPSVTDIVIVGGGVAGLSLAAALAGRARVCLLEREDLLASHASGGNAAIYRPLEDDETSAPLAARSRQLLAQWLEQDVLRPTGVLLVSSSAQRIDALAQRALRQGVRHRVQDRAALFSQLPWLQGGELRAGVLLQDGGVLDIHAMTTGLARVARQRGAQLQTGAAVARVLTDDPPGGGRGGHSGGRVRGVQLTDGTVIEAAAVVLAAGAWARELGRAVGADLPLTPLRRHLVHLGQSAGAYGLGSGAPEPPVLWRVEDEIYLRAESSGLLASPCDETVSAAEVPCADPAALDLLAQKLARMAPGLVGSQVQRSWACLRTFSSDRELVAGPDATRAGLFWFGGLGGRGMSVAPAAAELLAARVLGQAPTEMAAALAPARFARGPSDLA